MSTKTVLIVDDEASIREMIAIALEMADYQVLEADNAQTAHDMGRPPRTLSRGADAAPSLVSPRPWWSVSAAWCLVQGAGQSVRARPAKSTSPAQ